MKPGIVTAKFRYQAFGASLFTAIVFCLSGMAMSSTKTNFGQHSGARGIRIAKGDSLDASAGRAHVGSNTVSSGSPIIEGSGRMFVRHNDPFATNGDFPMHESGDAPATVPLQDSGTISAAGTVFAGGFPGRVGPFTQTGVVSI